MVKWSETWTWLEGDWHEGNVLCGGAADACLLARLLGFDGARAFEGVTPDLDRHCERLNASAGAGPEADAIGRDDHGSVKDGLKRFRSKEAIYIRPMYWAEDGGGGSTVPPNPETTRFPSVSLLHLP